MSNVINGFYLKARLQTTSNVRRSRLIRAAAVVGDGTADDMTPAFGSEPSKKNEDKEFVVTELSSTEKKDGEEVKEDHMSKEFAIIEK